MAVTKTIIDEVRWPDDIEFDTNDQFLAIVVREGGSIDDLQRDIVMLGSEFETIDEVAEELLRRIRSGHADIDFEPGWARLVKSDGTVTFTTDTFDPEP